MSIEMNDNLRRAMHRAPALRQPVVPTNPRGDWPDERDYVGNCRSCGSLFKGSKGRVQGHKCYQCAGEPDLNQAIPEPAIPAKVPLTVPVAHDQGSEPAGQIRAFLDFEPPRTTAQQKGVYVKNGKPKFFTKNKVKDAQREFERALRPIVPEKPLDGALSLSVEFMFPWLSSHTKPTRALRQIPHAKRLDCSNLVKLLEDVMTEMGFWHDDGQICDLRVRKWYAERPGIGIEINSL